MLDLLLDEFLPGLALGMLGLVFHFATIIARHGRGHTSDFALDTIGYEGKKASRIISRAPFPLTPVHPFVFFLGGGQERGKTLTNTLSIIMNLSGSFFLLTLGVLFRACSFEVVAAHQVAERLLHAANGLVIGAVGAGVGVG